MSSENAPTRGPGLLYGRQPGGRAMECPSCKPGAPCIILLSALDALLFQAGSEFRACKDWGARRDAERGARLALAAHGVVLDG